MPQHFSLLLQRCLQKLFWWHLGLLPDHQGMVALGDSWALLSCPVVIPGAAQRLPLLSSEVSPDSEERGRQGLSRADADLTSTVSKSVACHFDIHAALIWIWWPTPGRSGNSFPLSHCKEIRKNSWLHVWLCPLPHALKDGAHQVLRSVPCRVPRQRGQDAATFLLQLRPCFGREIRTGLRN